MTSKLNLSVVLLLLLGRLTTSDAQCVFNWAPGPAITTLQTIPGKNVVNASTNDHVNLSIRFYDREEITSTTPGCMGACPRYYQSYINSSYRVDFSIAPLGYASFDAPNSGISNKTVGAARIYNFPANGCDLGTNLFHNYPVTLFLNPTWAPTVDAPTPPPVTVTVRVTDITPVNSVPAGHTGNCTDGGILTYTWTFNYNTICPTYLTRSPTTSANDAWININGDHTAATCYGTPPAIDIVPFCYKAGPPLPPAAAPYYSDRIINEVFGPQIADFLLTDLNPDYVEINPGLTTPDEFARAIFPLAIPATFVIDNNDQFEDSHDANVLLKPIISFAFTHDAIVNGRVGYHFSLDYQCNGASFINTILSRRLQAGLLSQEPQLRKQH